MKRFDDKLNKCDDGKYMLFEDHQKAIKDLRKIIAEFMKSQVKAEDDMRDYVLKYNER